MKRCCISFCLLAALALCGLSTSTTLAGNQALQLSVPITATDHVGSTGTIHLGFDPTATFCTDPGLGETEYPPKAPPGIFDFRFLNPRIDDGFCFGLGRQIDFRTFVGIQKDTFVIKFNPSTDPRNLGYPMTISWPNLASSFLGPVRMVDQFGGSFVNVDMKTQTNAVIVNDAIDRVYIITNNPTLPVHSAPALGAIGLSLMVVLLAGFAVLMLRRRALHPAGR